MLAPIVIFAFNRPDSLKRLLRSLEGNALWQQSEKFLYVDGPRNDEEKTKVAEVAEIALKVTSNVVVSQDNLGLGKSVIRGVTEIVNRYGRTIVLEDDLVVMPGFLGYMNQMLDLLADNPKILAVCGYGLKIHRPVGYREEVYFGERASSWGWATWADRWNEVDWEVKDWADFSSSAKQRKAFNRGGSDMFGMLKDYMEGRNRSWAIRFCYHQFRKGLYSVHPFRSLVDNRGFGEEATNCRQKYSRFKIETDERQEVAFSELLPTDTDRAILKQLRRYHSVPRRIYSRLRKLFNI